MTKYQTRVFNVGDLTVTVSKAGKTAAEKVKALLEAISAEIDNSLPGGGKPPTVPGTPDQGLPEGGVPDNTLPGDQPEVGQLPEFADFLRDHAKEIAAAVLKGTLCDPDKEPK